MSEKDKKYDAKRAGTRFRNWTFLVYPESVSENWRDTLDQLCIKWCESPLHDKDLNENGEPKKPHVHILLTFNNVKTYEAVSKITESINGTIPQHVQSVQGMVRYFAHLDNPSKFQYNVSDIVAHCNFDLALALKANTSTRYALIRDMRNFIRENNIIHFSDLVDYAIENEYESWFPLLCDNSAFILKEYIKSIWRKSANYSIMKQKEIETEAYYKYKNEIE